MRIGAAIATSILLWAGVPRLICPYIGHRVSVELIKIMWELSPSIAVAIAIRMRVFSVL